MSLGRLELPLPASEADALSTELQGHDFKILPRRTQQKPFDKPCKIEGVLIPRVL